MMDQGLTAAGFGGEVLAAFRRCVTAALGIVRLARSEPGVGERAVGHGLSGIIASVPDHQPLGTDGVWRVVLKGESVGRLVRKRDGAWRLLQVDELTDAQLDSYEAGMSHMHGNRRRSLNIPALSTLTRLLRSIATREL